VSEWPMVSFLEVCDIEGGTQPPKETFRYEKTDGYIRMLQIQDFQSDHNAVFISEAGRIKFCKEEDVLIARYGASIGRILRGKAGAYNVALVKTVPNLDRIERGFLYHLLRGPSFQTFILSVGSRAAQAGFNKGDLERFQFLLPPLAEQRRIAEVLDRTEALRAKRRAALAQLGTLTQSIFLDLFGDPGMKPTRFPKKPLQELCGMDSSLVDPRLPQYKNLLHYGPDRIESHTGVLLPAKTAQEDGLTSAKFLFEADCVLYSKIRPNLNKVALAAQRGLCSAICILLRSGRALQLGNSFGACFSEEIS